MSYTITDYNPYLINLSDGFIDFYIPKFNLIMVVDEPYLTFYWSDANRIGVPREFTVDYNDVTSPSEASAADLKTTIEGYQISGFSAGTGQTWVVNGSVSAGAQNGVNKAYDTPTFIAGSLCVYVNGVRYKPTADFTELTTNSFQFTTFAPMSDDIILLDYRTA